MENIIKVKAKFGEQVRRFTVPSNLLWLQLCHQVKAVFEIEQVVLKYIDEEEDEVSLGSEGEFQEALKVVERTQLLRLIVNGLPVDSLDCKMDAFLLQDIKVQASKRKADEEEPMVITPEVVPPEENVENPTELVYTPLISSSDSEPTSSACLLEPKKKRKKKYYAALAEEIGKMNAEKIAELPKEKKKFRNPFRTAAPEEEESEKCKLSKNEKKMKKKSSIDSHLEKCMEKFVYQTVQGVLRGLDGAVIESHHGTSGKAVGSEETEPKTDKTTGKNVLYYHSGIICDNCELSIAGIRYKCGNCRDFDLCEQCESLEGVHDPDHVFLKLRYPVSSVGRKEGVMAPLLQEIIYKDIDKHNRFKGKGNEVDSGKDVKQMRKDLRREERMKVKEEKRCEKEALKAEKRRCREHLAGKRPDEDMKKQFKEERRRFKEELKKKRRMAAVHGDCITFDPRLRAEFVADHSIPDGMSMKVNTKFVKHWLMKNRGTIAWDEKTKLICKYGTIPVQHGYDVQVPCLNPGEQGIFQVEFISPSKPGAHHSVWKLSHDGSPFGPDVWCNIKVADDVVELGEEVCGSTEETHDKTSLTDSAFDSPQSPLLVSAPQSPSHELMAFELLNITDDMPQADGQLVKSIGSESLNNELEWDSANFTTDLNSPELNEEVQVDRATEETFEQSDDDDDNGYCIVPLPACFDPDVPLTAEDIMSASIKRDITRSTSISSSNSQNSMPSLVNSEISNTDTDTNMQCAAQCDDNINEHDFATIDDTQNNNEQSDSSESESEYETDDATDAVQDEPQVNTLIDTSDVVTSQPLVDITPAEPLPVSTQPEMLHPTDEVETPVLTQPGTPLLTSPISLTTNSLPTSSSSSVRRNPEIPTDFASTVVSGALATAIDAVASAGQAVGATLQNLIGVASVAGPREPEDGSASYSTESEQVQLNQASPTDMAMAQLFEMGFCDRKLNSQILAKNNNEVHQTITELLELHSDNWPDLRH